MENQHETPKSPEEDLAEKKEELKEAVSLMLDWQQSQKIEKSLFPHLDSLTSEELDYLLKYIRCLDNQMQLRGPLSDTAKEALIKSEKELEEFENNIGPNRSQELKNLLTGEDTD